MTVWLQIGGRRRRVELRSSEGGDATSGALACVVDGMPLAVEARLLRAGVLSLIVDGRQYRCLLDGDVVIIDGQRSAFEAADPRSLQARQGAGAAAEGARAVKAPMPGRVVRVLVNVGDQVEAQQGLVVIEAMKMQNELKSPKAGKVVRIAVAVGDTVLAGGVLVVVE
ncbi:acetyl-CoA carboxylase biotin carboxyl carrier protein subunit [Granulicella arctica]|uniref:Biotin carboxyl carrier protein n=1 Tax=Granulicella arctica TaxID=940613 RepID=A0A7Y9PF54_9BACT|nr:acetyl-CoA carboxylase biotin carboxyl carrier protein subunit [Granulicella arctica]NYF78788.1 biotin carboxyl carrier protein [Granulicella arctica]